MKKFLFSLSFLVSLSAFAQTKTLLNGAEGPQSWGIVLAGGMQGSQLYGENVWFSQFKAGVVLNQAWTIGASYGESVNYIRPASVRPLYAVPVELDFHQYSGFVEYRIKPDNLVHLSFPLHLGIMETDVDDFDSRDYDNDWMDLEGEDYQFFVEPGVNLELNLHQYARLYAGLSYRLPLASTYSEGISPDPENHLLINFGVKVGLFDMKSLRK